MSDAALVLLDLYREEAQDEVSSDIVTEEHRVALVMERVLDKLFYTQQKIGSAILEGLWEVYKGGYVRFLSEEYQEEDFPAWVLDKFGKYRSDKYLLQLVSIVTNMLQDIHAKEVQRIPYVNTKTSERITVNAMLQRPVGLLVTANQKIKNKPTEEKERILGVAMHSTRKDFHAKLEAGQPSDNGKEPEYIFYRIELDTVTGLTDIVLEGLTNEQVYAFESRLGLIAKQKFS